jgi:hypothetical protein
MGLRRAIIISLLADALCAQNTVLPSVSVKAFGALGNGTHEDTSAIQSAIDSAQSGETVYVPPGRYLTGAIVLKNGVTLTCASMYGSEFLAAANREVMFTMAAVSRSGISNCSASGNGKADVQFLEVNTYPATQNKFRDLYLHNLGIGIHTTDTYFDSFDNVRVFQPTLAGFQFEVNSNSITCNNCSVISTTPGTIGLQVHNSGAFVFNGGTLEGTVSTSVYQMDGVAFTGTYWENTGGTNSEWVTIGTATGTATSGISFRGCAFSTGANYALRIVQVSGLTVAGNSIATKLAGFLIDNRSSSAKRSLSIGDNSYNINGAGYDSGKIVSFAAASDNTLNSNINQEVVNPLLFTATPEPPDASLQNLQGVVYFDSRQRLWYKFKDGTGTVRHWLVGSDAIYYNPEFISADASLAYSRDGTDGAVLSGPGGVRLRNSASNAACLGQFGGFNSSISTRFSSIGLGPGDCLPPTDSTVHVMNKTDGKATTLDVQAGSAQGATPLVRVQDNSGQVMYRVSPDGSATQKGLAFTVLPAAIDGTFLYCLDCKNIQDGAAPGSTAAPGGTGAFLARAGSRWRIMN